MTENTNRKNDCSGSVDPRTRNGRPNTANTTAKIEKAKDFAVIFLISVFSLLKLHIFSVNISSKHLSKLHIIHFCKTIWWNVYIQQLLRSRVDATALLQTISLRYC